MKTNNVEEFFGTLLYSDAEVHKSHLKTTSHKDHVVLNDFYTAILDDVDNLIETYQGLHGKVGAYKNLLQTSTGDAKQYLLDLQEMVRQGREDFCKESELQSICDTILEKIASTLYKLTELKESKKEGLVNYLIEALNEDTKADRKMYVGEITKLRDDLIENINPLLSKLAGVHGDIKKIINSYPSIRESFVSEWRGERFWSKELSKNINQKTQGIMRAEGTIIPIYEGEGDCNIIVSPTSSYNQKETIHLKISEGEIDKFLVGPLNKDKTNMDMLGDFNVTYVPQLDLWEVKTKGRSLSVQYKTFIAIFEEFANYLPEALENFINFEENFLKKNK